MVIAKIVFYQNVKSWFEKKIYWMVTKNERFGVILGSFGHDSLRWLASMHNDKFIFLFLKFLQQYFHCQNEIDFKVWKETVKVTDSYGKKWLKVQLQLNLFEKTHYHLGFR